MAIAVFILASCGAFADSPAREVESADLYFSKVQPIMREACLKCHGDRKQEGGLRLDTREAMLRGGENGAAIEPGVPGRSLLIRAVGYAESDLQMPPKQKLSDGQIAALTQWVELGAPWPDEVLVLFDDERSFLDALNRGDAERRIVESGAGSGRIAMAVSIGERFAEQVADWRISVREHPASGQYRYLRLAWKSVGGAAPMLEVAADGKWPPAKSANPPGGRYIAGPANDRLDAIALADEPPTDWQVVTIDLWKDMGDFELTGLSLMTDRGEEAMFDMILLGRTVADLDAYQPGRGKRSFELSASESRHGDAWTDAQNPVRKLWLGERLDLWSLKPLDRSAPPALTGGGAELSAIDRYVRMGLRDAGLTPSAESDRRTLIRRLTFDLTGLPPTPEAVRAFMEDDRADAYERLVDRLLNDRAYGEHWAEQWLDIVRYADTMGHERDEFRPNMHRYRDYVIRAFNSDKGYDRFVLEQLAGDETLAGPPQTSEQADALLATGFLHVGTQDSTAALFGEQAKARDEWMADLANTTASAFLAMTLSCAQCHDHKYDPITQADHFRLRAFFAAVERRDEPVTGSAAAEGDPPVASIVRDVSADVPETRILFQGNIRTPMSVVEPGIFSVFDPNPTTIEKVAAPESTGRRTALAKWIIAPDNPLTARVMVNRIWQRHFGTPLVATPNDFGYPGARPTHPALLDWLAAEFIRSGWSIKHMERLIVTSATYRQASNDRPQEAAKDPHNTLLWRQNTRRLSAESMRDAMLSVSGLMQDRHGGPPAWPPVSDEILRSVPGVLEAIDGKDEGRGQGWVQQDPAESDVRAAYLVKKRSVPIPFLQPFDVPDTTMSCGRRDVTTVAPQALNLLNSEFSARTFDALADRVMREVGDKPDDDRIVDLAFGLALSRSPTDTERGTMRQLLASHRVLHASRSDADRAAVVDLCRVIVNLNEFVYID